MSALGGRQTFCVTSHSTHSGPSPKLVGTSMNGSMRSFAMPQSSATGAAIRTNEVGAARPVTRAAFRFSSHRFRPKGGCRCHCDCDDDGCRPHCDCHDESAVDSASPLALVGLLS